LISGISDSKKETIDLFERTGFIKKFFQLKSLFESNKITKEKFEEDSDSLALKAVELIVQEDVKNNEESDEEYEEYNENSDDLQDFIDDNEYEVDDEGSDGSEEENESRRRKQSVDDSYKDLKDKSVYDLENILEHDFNGVLNNRVAKKTNDNRVVIDEEYIENCNVAITDFGRSFFLNKRPNEEIQDRFYRSVESILAFDYSKSTDIWSLGCLVFELLTGFPLFPVDDNEFVDKDTIHLFFMEKYLGPIPIDMKTKSKRSRYLFNSKNHKIRNVDDFTYYPIEEMLVKQYLFSEKESAEIGAFLRKCLKYIPSKRATVDELLNDSWLMN
jgi:hypothetical protein